METKQKELDIYKTDDNVYNLDVYRLLKEFKKDVSFEYYRETLNEILERLNGNN